ncbi:hypothetical protein ACFQX6_52660 [Streptosporangium lutulentum]
MTPTDFRSAARLADHPEDVGRRRAHRPLGVEPGLGDVGGAQQDRGRDHHHGDDGSAMTAATAMTTSSSALATPYAFERCSAWPGRWPGWNEGADGWG